MIPIGTMLLGTAIHKKVKGIPVKSVTSVEALYTKHVGTPKSETIRKRIKTETLLLRSVQDSAAGADFEYPEAFQLVYVE